MTKKNTDRGPGESGSKQRLRRYHRREERRRAQERADSRFMAAVFSLAGVGAALAIGLAVWAMGGGGVSSDLGYLSQPWIGQVSRLEVLSVVFVAGLGVLFYIRTRSRK